MNNMTNMPNIRHILPHLCTSEAAAIFATLFTAEAIIMDDNYVYPPPDESIITSFPHTILFYTCLLHNKTWDFSKPLLTYKEAMDRSDHDLWQTVIDIEYKNLMDQKVFVESNLPSSKKAISARWIFTKKNPPHFYREGSTSCAEICTTL